MITSITTGDWNAPLTSPTHHNSPAGNSKVAARQIARHARTHRSRMLTLIRERGAYGLTDAEGEAQLGIKPQSYTPRRRELVVLGLVVDSGRRRNTECGLHAAAWVVPNHASRQSVRGVREAAVK